MTFISTKTYGHEIGLSCAFRQWKAHSHCSKIHGYALAVKFQFQAEELDNCGWVVDFGSLKSLKGMLEDTFDHKLLVSEDDPYKDEICALAGLGIADVIVVERTGCEAFAKLIYECAEVWLKDNGYSPRCALLWVEVSEHGANSAIYIGEE
jgi:6-pyruvoyltetrahydropterin/6-carboxytetrahydropterin synthase